MLLRIHGRDYDVSKFKDRHPGGARLMESCIGVDATAAFESYHALADRTRVDSVLASLECPSRCLQPRSDGPTFSSEGFYEDVKSRVKKRLNGRSTKWTPEWCCWLGCTTFAYLVSFYVAFFQTECNFLVREVASGIAGTAMMCAMLQGYHDASHSALSRSQAVNDAVMTVGSGLAMWDSETWTRHHSVLHHSFTGDYALDPDTRHAHPFLRKSPSSRTKIGATRNFIMTILSVFPGMFLGQVIGYVRVQCTNAIWGFSIRNKKPLIEWILMCLQAACLMHGRSVILAMIYFLFLNLNYSAFILPDHDQAETAVNHAEGDVDWGEMQVRNSGNFAEGNMILTRMYGGINFQIEHHLFPSLCSWHLPYIAPAVKEACAEHNVPYVSNPSLFDSYMSAIDNLQNLNVKRE